MIRPTVIGSASLLFGSAQAWNGGSYSQNVTINFTPSAGITFSAGDMGIMFTFDDITPAAGSGWSNLVTYTPSVVTGGVSVYYKVLTTSDLSLSASWGGASASTLFGHALVGFVLRGTKGFASISDTGFPLFNLPAFSQSGTTSAATWNITSNNMTSSPGYFLFPSDYYSRFDFIYFRQNVNWYPPTTGIATPYPAGATLLASAGKDNVGSVSAGTPLESLWAFGYDGPSLPSSTYTGTLPYSGSSYSFGYSVVSMFVRAAGNQQQMVL